MLRDPTPDRFGYHSPATPLAGVAFSKPDLCCNIPEPEIVHSQSPPHPAALLTATSNRNYFIHGVYKRNSPDSGPE